MIEQQYMDTTDNYDIFDEICYEDFFYRILWTLSVRNVCVLHIPLMEDRPTNGLTTKTSQMVATRITVFCLECYTMFRRYLQKPRRPKIHLWYFES